MPHLPAISSDDAGRLLLRLALGTMWLSHFARLMRPDPPHLLLPTLETP